MPCLNKVMGLYNKQVKLTACFLERKLVDWSDWTEYNDCTTDSTLKILSIELKYNDSHSD